MEGEILTLGEPDWLIEGLMEEEILGDIDADVIQMEILKVKQIEKQMVKLMPMVKQMVIQKEILMTMEKQMG